MLAPSVVGQRHAMQYVTVGEIARLHNVPPRVISDAFYSRKLDDSRCIIAGGRRLIPRAYVPDVVEYLRRAGHLDGRGSPALACQG
jgi:hypothetical protein